MTKTTQKDKGMKQEKDCNVGRSGMQKQKENNT
jgi:hypothetical protein